MDRLESERTFHNRQTEQHTRAQALKYYSVTSASTEDYHARLTVPEGGRALEYGCGQGAYALELAACGVNVTGIDISDEAIRVARNTARARGLSVRFEVMNAETLTFPDASFDLVCGTGILHHLALDRAFFEIARVLKPTGRAVFAEPLGHNPLIRLYRWLTPSLRTPDEHPLLMRDLDLARRHFASVETAHYHLATLAAVPLRHLPGFPRIVRALGAADAFAFRAVPYFRRYSWYVVIDMAQPRRDVLAA